MTAILITSSQTNDHKIFESGTFYMDVVSAAQRACFPPELKYILLSNPTTRAAKLNPENKISTSLANEIKFEFIYFCHFHLGKYIKIRGKINSHICLMLSVYKSFHQTVKYGRQRNHILQDFTGLEI